MEQFLSLQYYFNPRPAADFQFTKLTLILVLLLFALSIVLKIYRKKYVKDVLVKKMLKRYPSRFFAFGIILICLLLFREAGMPFLSMRLWWVLLFIYIVYWAVRVCFGFKKEYRRRAGKMAHNVMKSKYLPKKKK